MTWVKDFRSGVVQFDDGTLRTIAGLTRLRVSSTTEIRKEITGGSPRNRTAHMVRAEPILSFTTVNIYDALNHIGATGICVTDFRAIGQRQDCQGVQSGAVHDQYATTLGVIVPTTLSVDHQGNAQITYDVYAASTDGVTSPLIKSEVAMPALGTPRRFQLYDFQVAGNILEGKRNVTINWNPQVTQESADDSVYPTAVHFSSEMPVVTLRGVDPDWIDVIDFGGAQGISIDTILRFKDRDQLIASLQHISMSFNAAVSWNTYLDAGPESPGECEIQMDTYAPAVSAAIGVSLGVALL